MPDTPASRDHLYSTRESVRRVLESLSVIESESFNSHGEQYSVESDTIFVDVVRILNRMDKVYKSVITFVLVLGCSYDEAADRLQLAEDEVENLVDDGVEYIYFQLGGK